MTGYKDFSLIRASVVVNCHLIAPCAELPCPCQQLVSSSNSSHIGGWAHQVYACKDIARPTRIVLSRPCSANSHAQVCSATPPYPGCVLLHQERTSRTRTTLYEY